MRFHLRRLVAFLLMIVGLGLVILTAMMHSTDSLDDDIVEGNRVHNPASKSVHQRHDDVMDDVREHIAHVQEMNDTVEEFIAGAVVIQQVSNMKLGSNLRMNSTLQLWPENDHPWHDRIVNQLKYVPKSYNPSNAPVKKIYVAAGIKDKEAGRKYFEENKCPVSSCFLTGNRRDFESADAVVLHQGITFASHKRREKQVWVLYLLESPVNTGGLGYINQQKINWTATYRSDSTLVTPYEKFVHFANFTKLPDKPIKNYAVGKSKMVAWFVSNCGANNKRLQYAKELQKYISVDIYGSCGTLSCPRNKGTACFDILSHDYKFYLSFENSNCEYYITEKLYWNGLSNDVIPIVMGGRKQDYKAAAPPHSIIHVEDFPSAKELADYLIKLDKNDDLYNEYFLWKGTGEFINTKFWCRLCALVHDDSGRRTWYNNVNEWWRGKQTCTGHRWDHDTRVTW